MDDFSDDDYTPSEDTPRERAVPLHVKPPPPSAPRSINGQLSRAAQNLVARRETLTARRKQREQRVADALTARMERCREKLDTLETTAAREERYVSALREWRTQQRESMSRSHTDMARERQNRAACVSRDGQSLQSTVETKLACVPPTTPRKVATYGRFDRLLKPLAKLEQPEDLNAAYKTKIFVHEQATQRVKEQQVQDQARRRETRAQREQFAKERQAQRTAEAHHRFQLGVRKSQAAWQRAMKIKERIANPRRALAIERLEAREAERRRRRGETTAEDDELFPPRPEGHEGDDHGPSSDDEHEAAASAA